MTTAAAVHRLWIATPRVRFAMTMIGLIRTLATLHRTDHLKCDASVIIGPSDSDPFRS